MRRLFWILLGLLAPAVASADGFWIEAGLRVETLTLGDGLTFDCTDTVSDLCSSGLNGTHTGQTVGGSVALFFTQPVWSLGARVAAGQGSFSQETPDEPAPDPHTFIVVALELPLEARTTIGEFDLFVQVVLRLSSYSEVDGVEAQTQPAFGGLVSAGARFHGFGVTGGRVVGGLTNGASGELTYRLNLGSDDPPAKPAPPARRPAPAASDSQTPANSEPAAEEEPGSNRDEATPDPSSPSSPSAPSADEP